MSTGYFIAVQLFLRPREFRNMVFRRPASLMAFAHIYHLVYCESSELFGIVFKIVHSFFQLVSDIKPRSMLRECHDDRKQRLKENLLFVRSTKPLHPIQLLCLSITTLVLHKFVISEDLCMCAVSFLSLIDQPTISPTSKYSINYSPQAFSQPLTNYTTSF